MAQAHNFDRRLKGSLDDQRLGYYWECGKRLDSRSIIDLAGLKNGELRIIVEVELKKDNPVENVVKVWNWASRKRPKYPVLFLHAFSGHYRGRPRSRSGIFSARENTKAKQYERAVFVGKKMKQDRNLRIRYKELSISTTSRLSHKVIAYTPRIRRGFNAKAGGGAMHRAADRLARTIAESLRRNFR